MRLRFVVVCSSLSLACGGGNGSADPALAPDAAPTLADQPPLTTGGKVPVSDQLPPTEANPQAQGSATCDSVCGRATSIACDFGRTNCTAQCKEILGRPCSQEFLQLLDCAISVAVCPAQAQALTTAGPVDTGSPAFASLWASCEDQEEALGGCVYRNAQDPNAPPIKLRPFE